MGSSSAGTQLCCKKTEDNENERQKVSVIAYLHLLFPFISVGYNAKVTELNLAPKRMNADLLRYIVVYGHILI